MPVTYSPKTGLVQFRAPLSLVGQLETMADDLGVSRPDLMRYLIDLGMGIAQGRAHGELRDEILRRQIERSYHEAQRAAVEAGVIGLGEVL